MGDIEEQIKELKRKAASYESLLAVLSKHSDAIVSLAEVLRPYSMDKKRSSGQEKKKLQEMYNNLIKGIKVSYTPDDVAEYLQVQNGNYHFAKLCSMDGVEKIKDNGRVRAIFHVNKMGDVI